MSCDGSEVKATMGPDDPPTKLVPHSVKWKSQRIAEKTCCDAVVRLFKGYSVAKKVMLSVQISRDV